MCVGYPQRDFALRDILPTVYFSLGREVPTYKNFDEGVFVSIYAMLEGCSGQMFTDLQLAAFWSPMVAEIRRMRSVSIAIDVDHDVGTGGEGETGNAQDGEYTQGGA